MNRLVAGVAGGIIVVAGVVVAVTLSGSSPGSELPSNPLDFYSPSVIVPIEHETAVVEKSADRATAAWIAKHGTSNDSGFAAYAVRKVGAVPSAAVQDSELGQLRSLEQHRTAEGVAAATYLEAHGKKDVWQTFGDAYDALPNNGHDNAKNLIDAAYTLGNDVADTAQATYQRLSPYEVDPSLNGTIHRDASQGRYSFPSGHATLAAAEATVMARLEPQRTKTYRFLEAEIDYSRLYVAAHYPSDVLRGAFLGRMVGDYTLADHQEWVPH
jgi:hypothetical protein